MHADFSLMQASTVGTQLFGITDALQHKPQGLYSTLTSQDSVSGWCFCCRELPAHAVDAGAMATTNKLLCDEECIANLESLQTEETKTGLKYKDIVVGKGPSPPTGYQV